MPVPRLTKIILLIGVLLSAAPVLAQGIYKWVDENGKVHFGDKPPAGGESAEELQIKNTPAPAEAELSAEQRLDRQQRLLDSFAAERAEKKQAAAEAKARKVERAAKCNQARDNLTQMRQAGYLYDLDAAGERIVYSDEKRAAMTAEYESKIKQFCK